MSIQIEDKELYKNVKKKLPHQKKVLDKFKNMLKEAEIVIAEGKEEYRQGITTEFEFAGFMRESKELVNDLKEVIKNYSSHIDTTEDFIYLYEDSNE